MATNDATLEALLPQLLELIKGQQYEYLMRNPGAAGALGWGQSIVPQNAVPLNDAVVKMAYGLMPVWAREGLSTATGAGSPGAGFSLNAQGYDPSAQGHDPMDYTDRWGEYQKR